MRGEHFYPGKDNRTLAGSSPHARGTQEAEDGVQLRAGIIPACAGNTCSLVSEPHRLKDHPRMRGEHTCKV